jgi:2-(1,2-epoxy-1,2-dihydrophenyl)acetyl-CoA isomerase
VGEKIAAELLMTGSTISAQRASEIGLINRIVAADELAPTASVLAAQLAKAPTAAIGRIKRMLNSSFANSLEQQLALEHECQIESGRGDDFREGVAAFFEKRVPDFTGI